ncbi:hypothetical protein WISP_36420 [Willisornis vidua]|uniref:Uncharacterized protein n=1 Tax=Willisornis vidua TaxID=1566151 RepID=A0ABQ9DP64_9PASS|nr:hypothetical protein WISP_36420 [Willisornis vidua]
MNPVMDMTQKCALTTKSNLTSTIKGGDSAPLLCSYETPPAVLHPAPEPSAQEGCGPVGVSLEEGHNYDQRTGAPLLSGKAEIFGDVQSGEEKALETP